jgi:hypothetical protein
MRRGRFLVCLDDNRNEDTKPWRTMLDELRHLIANAQDRYNEAARVRNGSWLAPYLASHWLPLLPNAEAPEFNRGFAHGSRITIQVHVDLFRGLNADDVVLLFCSTSTWQWELRAPGVTSKLPVICLPTLVARDQGFRLDSSHDFGKHI